MTDTETRAGLSADHVWALRHADHVTFHTSRGKSRICASLRPAGAARVYTAREQVQFADRNGLDEPCVNIPVHSARLEDYGTGRSGDYSGFVSWMDRLVWRTIAGTLRKGDRLCFVWIASNNSPIMTAAGLHMDSLRLYVEGSGRKNPRAFEIKTEVGRDLARMVIRK